MSQTQQKASVKAAVKVAPNEKKITKKSLHECVTSLVKLAKIRKDSTYLAVSTDAKGSVTAVNADSGSLALERSMGREYMKTQFGSKPYRTVLVKDEGNRSSAASTALQYVATIDPVATADFANFAALFDDFRSVEAMSLSTYNVGVAPTVGFTNLSPLLFLTPQWRPT
jgi:hypothetical protein